MLRRTRPAHFEQARIDPWPGFTDIMTGLLLIFVFVITLFTITETILSRSLSEKDTELDRLQRQVSVKTDEIEKLKHEIDRLQETVRRPTEKSDRSGRDPQAAARTAGSGRCPNQRKERFGGGEGEDGHVASTRN